MGIVTQITDLDNAPNESDVKVSVPQNKKDKSDQIQKIAVGNIRNSLLSVS